MMLLLALRTGLRRSAFFFDLQNPRQLLETNRIPHQQANLTRFVSAAFACCIAVTIVACAQRLQNSTERAQVFAGLISSIAIPFGVDTSRRRRTVSKVRNSGQEYRELFESNPRPMWVYDLKTLRFLAVNKAAIRNYGYSRDEFLSMRTTDIRLSQQSTARQPGELEEITVAQGRHQKKDGAVIEVETTSYQIIFGERNALVETCREVSDAQRAEEGIDRQNLELEHRVKERTTQLEATNRELEAFCYSVSHDLRAPLRSIRGFSEVLLEKYGATVDTRGQELLRRVCESSQMMDRLIEDLLKLSRVTRAELQRRSVNLSALAERIADELQDNDPFRSVQFNIAPNLVAEGDERLLHVVLENLLRNAWKFTSKRPEASIEFGASDDPERAFFVRDNGAGFDMAFAGKLFGVFQRLHSPSEFAGTGVGLAIVQRIINRHGGRTWATGRVNEGATFYFTFSPSWT